MYLTLCVLQINHMKRFIEQEAREKAEEIMIKARELVLGWVSLPHAMSENEGHVRYVRV